MLLKGLLHEEDCKRALDAGVDGLVLSNHGGRQLDCAPTPISQLPPTCVQFLVKRQHWRLIQVFVLALI